MKNTLIVIAIIVVFLIIYFLQANFFVWFTIGGIQPNLFVIMVLFLGLFAGRKVAIPISIFIGICMDFFISKKIGISGMMLGIIAVIGGYLDKNFSKDSRITIILMVIGGTLIYEIGIYVMNVIISSAALEILPFLKILAIETIYNVLLTIILYPLLQKIGYKLEENFKESRILTRYF